MLWWIGLAGAGFLLLMLLPFLITFPIACWETRYVWPYEPLQDRPPPVPGSASSPTAGALNPYASPPAAGEAPPPMTSEAKFWNESAQALGMRYVGVLRHATSSLIRARYDFWLSPGREFLAIVAGGKVASIPVNSIFLWTVLGDGRIFITLNAEASADPDLTGMTTELLFPGDGFQLLSQTHWNRLLASGATPQLFSAEQPLRDLQGIRRMKYDRLEELGYCRFLDSDRNAYRLTVRGAFWYACIGLGRGFRRQISPDRAPALPSPT